MGEKADMKIPLVDDDIKPYTEDVNKEQTLDGSFISYRGIYYTVEVKDKKKLFAKVSNEILTDVSGRFEPGLNAIMGPSGSGKTTLLDILAGRKEKSRVSGQVLVDGSLQPDNFNLMAGYVEQEDVLMGTMTVRETLEFSANLRLSKDISNEEKTRRVEETIYQLGLEKCADSKIGNSFIRGLSGGEKKRTSIGMELIVSPSMLFLDEPTTGLDATSADAIIQMLYRLSRDGRTIIFSIHQPRYTIYELFDRLSVLCQGNTIYHGRASQSLAFFQSLGYVCKPFNNPADFFMDVLHGRYGGPHGQSDFNGKSINGHVVDIDSLERESSTRAALSAKLAEAYKGSAWHDKEMKQLDSSLTSYQSDSRQSLELLPTTASCFTQYAILTRRDLMNVIRTPQVLFMQVCVQVLFSTLMGTIFFRLHNDFPSGIQNRLGAIFLTVINAVIANKWAVDVFFDERRIFIRERAGGFYSVTPAFISKVITDIIPMRLLPTAASTLISYYMIGFRPDLDKFSIFFLVVFLNSVCSVTLAYLCSASFNSRKVASLVWTLGSMTPLLFSGFFINIRDVSVWLRWTRYLSYVRYSLGALGINELKDASFCKTVMNATICNPEAGNEYLTEQGISYTTVWDLWQNVVGLSTLSAVYLLLAYIQLRKLKLTT